MSRDFFLEPDQIENFPSGVRSVYINGKRVKKKILRSKEALEKFHQ